MLELKHPTTTIILLSTLLSKIQRPVRSRATQTGSGPWPFHRTAGWWRLDQPIRRSGSGTRGRERKVKVGYYDRSGRFKFSLTAPAYQSFFLSTQPSTHVYIQ